MVPLARSVRHAVRELVRRRSARSSACPSSVCRDSFGDAVECALRHRSGPRNAFLTPSARRHMVPFS
eukprot:5507259-Lingulodinium_polyedra.AAC.1